MAIVSRRSPLRTPVKVVENVFGKKLAPYLVMLAIFVALFGLAAYLAKDKIKEKFTSPASPSSALAAFNAGLAKNEVSILGKFNGKVKGKPVTQFDFVWTGPKGTYHRWTVLDGDSTKWFPSKPTKEILVSEESEMKFVKVNANGKGKKAKLVLQSDRFKVPGDVTFVEGGDTAKTVLPPSSKSFIVIS